MLSRLTGSRLSFRSFHETFLSRDRFTRDGLRTRFQKQGINNFQRKNNVIQEVIMKDQVPVRPMSDLLKCLGFTLFTGTAAFTTAIVLDSERAKKYYTAHRHQEGNPLLEKLGLQNKNVLALVGMNVLVFALWKVKPLQAAMWRYFTNSFASRSLCLPMLTSVFSHSSFIHLGLNMYVASTFIGIVAEHLIGAEQFWAFYITAGVFSSLTSLAHKALIRNPIRALGASGAILAVLAFTCMEIPQARLSIIFVPGFDFSAQSALIGIIAFDLAGLVFRFRLFDHAAHLGGAMFGVLYSMYGKKIFWEWYGDKFLPIWKRFVK